MPTPARPQPATPVAPVARSKVPGHIAPDPQRPEPAGTQIPGRVVETSVQAVEALVRQVLHALTRHAASQASSPQAAAPDRRSAGDPTDEAGLSAEGATGVDAERQQAAVRNLVLQLRSKTPDADNPVARFVVLCADMTHQVQQRAGQLPPPLAQAWLAWANIAARMAARPAQRPSVAVVSRPDAAAAGLPGEFDGSVAGEEDPGAALDLCAPDRSRP